jgi:hypothetical protein
MDLSRLEKLLNLTQSENDHEALAAVRAANTILKTHNKRWVDVLRLQGGFGDSIRIDFRESAVNDDILRWAREAVNQQQMDMSAFYQRQAQHAPNGNYSGGAQEAQMEDIKEAQKNFEQ